MMKNNKDPFKAGFIFIQQPHPFKHRQLSLYRQRKDAKIKTKQSQLQHKKHQEQSLHKKYINAYEQFKKQQQSRKQQNLQLILKQQKLKKDLFKLSIRRDQIQSKINFSITIEKANIVKKYLKCLPYTAGRRLELIQSCGSYKTYDCLHFLLRFIINRFFKIEMNQSIILSNLARIVFCKKVYFQQQWIMVTLKQCTKIQTNNNNEIKKSLVNAKPKSYILNIYAIEGKYFSIQKSYSLEDLKGFIEFNQYEAEDQDQDSPKISKINNSRHRLSVVDNIKSNFSKFVPQRNKKQKTQVLISSQISERSKDTINLQESNNSSSQRDDLTIKQTENGKSVMESCSQNQSSVSSESFVKSLLQENSLSQQTIQNEIQCNKKHHTTAKSNFSVKSKYSLKSKKLFKLDASKMKTSRSNILFQKLLPCYKPLFNIVLLKQQSLIYFIKEYLKQTQKRIFIQKSITRLKLNYKMKTEKKKNLYYKVIYLDKLYQNYIGDDEYMRLGFLFTLKCHQNVDQAQVFMHCSSINDHYKLKSAANLKILIHRQQIYRDQNTIKDSSVSKRNMKLMKSSSLKKGYSRQSKRASTEKKHKNANLIQKNTQIQTAYNAYVQALKERPQPMIEKLYQFLQNHIFSIEKIIFLKRQQIKKSIYKIIYVQNKVRTYIKKGEYRLKQEFIKTRTKINKKTMILIIAQCNRQQGTLKVFIQDLSKDGPYRFIKKQYDHTHEEVIFNVIQRFQNDKSLIQTDKFLETNILTKIQQKIQRLAKKQRERPQKNRKILQKFLYQLYLRQRAKKNIIFLKKISVKQNKFVLIIRRDKFLRNILQCTLTDIQSSKQNNQYNESNSCMFEMAKKQGKNQQNSEMSNNVLNGKRKFYKYQKIYLKQQYFHGMDRKKIVNQFYIDKDVFLLKPFKSYNVYFIQRLASININSQQFVKEITIIQKNQYNEAQNSRLQMNSNSYKSVKKLKNGDKNQIFNLNNQKQNKPSLPSKKDKKTSINISESYNDILSYIKENFIKDKKLLHPYYSKKTFTDIGNKGRYFYSIFQDFQEQQIYYSFYKEQNIFFVVDYFTLKRNKTKNGRISQELFKIHSQTLDKQQLVQNLIITKKLASWMYLNEKLNRKQIKNLQSQNTFVMNELNSVTLDQIIGFNNNTENHELSYDNAEENINIKSEIKLRNQRYETSLIRIPIANTSSVDIIASSKQNLHSGFIESNTKPFLPNPNILLTEQS